MKTIKYYIPLIIIINLFTTGCKKINPIKGSELSSLNIVNVVSGSGGIKINLNREIIARNTSQLQAISAGNGIIKAYDAISNAVYYNKSQATANGGSYSLYLTGTSSAPEGIWVNDSIRPYGTTNTTTTVRVVNLSNAGNVNVTLESAPTINVFSDVAYKAVSTFKDFSMPIVVPAGTTTFQFRNVTTNALIASFSLPENARNRSYAIILKGLVGGLGDDALSCVGQQFY